MGRKTAIIAGLAILLVCGACGGAGGSRQQSTGQEKGAGQSVSNSPGVSSPAAYDGQAEGLPAASHEPKQAPSSKPASPVTHKATLAAIGDVLIHNSVYNDARTKDGGYDFKPMLKPVKELLTQPDLLVANQESITGGEELGLSSYPMFNSPFQVGDALLDAGVDMVTMANNHTLDKREKGVLSATSYWDKIGMPYTGAFRSAEDQSRLRTLEKNGISFAFLAYTYGTNGIPVPEGKPYLVNLLDPVRMEQEIRDSKAKADFTVVSVHWGTEYQEEANTSQRELAQKLADWGADVIIGTHPHVLQTIEWVTAADGRSSLVMYSLGNFLSAQEKTIQLVGGIGQVEAVKTVTGGQVELRLENPVFTPVYTSYVNWRNYSLIPMGELEGEAFAQPRAVWEKIKARMLRALPELQVRDGAEAGG
ncbi:MAG: CapA family protein [Paenibacillaceae bacterium]|jgi:poly-gamma-glutamate synthesis protein (capsule biosynthesis protein)|nr:CapA family protein [Paenibacillaceae bacterium]